MGGGVGRELFSGTWHQDVAGWRERHRSWLRGREVAQCALFVLGSCRDSREEEEGVGAVDNRMVEFVWREGEMPQGGKTASRGDGEELG